MSQFKQIKVKDIKKETNEAVSIAFDVDVKNKYSYQPGQYITIKAKIDGEEIRRSYSLCSTPFEDDFKVVAKKIKNGRMSTFLNESLKIGDELLVMPPSGNFIPKDLTANLVGFAAGSGITPIFSILKSVIKAGGKFTLYYGNVNEASTIFKTQIDALITENPNQLTVVYTYDEGSAAGLPKINCGRIDQEKIKQFVQQNTAILKSDEFFICGPAPMINNVNDSLLDFGVSKQKIYFELFTARIKNNNNKPATKNTFTGVSQLTVIMDGEEFNFELDANGSSILDAAMDAGVDAPFSCKGAVCCTCKAQIVEGKAEMEMNYALSDAEVKDGFILTCQAHPTSEKLVIDYDVI